MQYRLLSCCAVLAVSSAVLAEEPAAPAESSSTNRLPEVVVTGMRVPTAVETSPTSISVITRDQIDAQQATTVADVLRNQAGVEVARTGQPGQQTSVFMRGANYDNTLVLIDGIRVNNGFNNAFDFANLPVDNIERIEVLRGPQSTLYGSEALGGVINIVTKKHADTLTGAATVEGGSYNSLHSHVEFMEPIKTHDAGTITLAGDGGYFTTDNDRPNNYLNSWNGSGRATWEVSDRFRATLLGTYLQSKAGSPGDRFTKDPNDWLRNENSMIGLTLQGQPLDFWDIKLTFAHNRDRSFYDAPDNPPAFVMGNFTELTTVSRDQVDMQHIFTINDQHRILVGGAYDDTHADDLQLYSMPGYASTNKISRPIIDKAVYGQYEFTPVQRFTFTAGGRLDDYNTFGSHATYRFGGRWTMPVTETILRASVGTGFRSPAVRDLYSPAAFGGNPNLQPERSLGWDAGIEQPLFEDKLRIGATYFQNEFDNLIGSSATTNVLVNVKRARTMGVETFVAWIPLTNLTVRATYTWLADAKDLTTGQRLLRRAEHSGSFGVTYRFLDRFTANLNTTLVGSRPDAFYDPVTYASTRVTNGGYAKVDIGLSCDISKHFTVFGRVENLLDEHYEEIYGYPALDRTFWVGGTAKF
ncbi:MAG: TonB-dependent receptor [Verrucomicrobiia bacterium]